MNTRDLIFDEKRALSRLLHVFGLAAILVSGVDARQSIRQVDFRNFIFPISGPKLGHDRMKWLDVAGSSHVRIVNGKGEAGSSGFTLGSVKFLSVTGSGNEDAAIVLHFDTGGTQQTDYVYIYSFANGGPKLLGYFHTGDRAHSGLYRVYGQDGKLVVELFDPKKRSGDCCSSGLVRTRYKWNTNHFETVGAPEFVAVPER